MICGVNKFVLELLFAMQLIVNPKCIELRYM